MGIFDGKEKGTDTTPLFFRYDYFDEARGSGWGKGMVGWYTIRIKDPARAADMSLNLIFLSLLRFSRIRSYTMIVSLSE